MSYELATSLNQMKDKGEVFFVNLVILHFLTGDVFLAALDQDIEWFKPNTDVKQKYLAVPLQIGSVSKSADSTVDNVELTISNVNSTFSSALFNATDFRGTMVSIIQIAYPDSLTDSSQYKYLFYGYMDEPKFKESDATFTTTLCAVVPNMTNHRTLGLTCSSWFGDSEECGATLTKVIGKVAAESTTTVIHMKDSALLDGSTFVDDYFKNGVITVGWEARKVISSTGKTVTVEYPFFNDKMTDLDFTLENGCDGSLADCKRHGNQQNFGGFPAIPTELVIKAN